MSFRATQAKGPSVQPPASGGGGGNVSGTLTSGTVPVASGAHTLVDSFLTYAANLFTMAKALTLTELLTVIKSVAGGNFGVIVKNSSNTASAAAVVQIQLGGALAAEASLLLTGSGSTSRVGWDEQNARVAIAVAGAAITSPSMWLTATEIRAVVPLVIQTSSKVTPVALAIAATLVAVDADLADLYTLTLDQSATLSNPTNPRTGRKFMVRVRHNGAGAWTLAYGGAYRFPSGTTPVISANTGQVTYLGFVWNETDSTWDNVGLSQPFG